jgi:hypothetical protein
MAALMRKAMVMSVASGILVMGLLGLMAVPVSANTSDPSYFLNCISSGTVTGTVGLQEGITPTATTCTSTGTLKASGLAVTGYTVGSVSNGVVYVNTAGASSGTYLLVDCGSSTTCATSTTIGSGSFSGTVAATGCSGVNSILYSGVGNTGAVVKSGDIMELTLTINNAAVSFCSGSTGTLLTPTAVNTVATIPTGAPQFPAGSVGMLAIVGLMVPALLLLRRNSAFAPATA